MEIYIDGVLQPYALGSVDLDDAVGERSTASFTIVDKVGDMKFTQGQNVGIYEIVEGSSNLSTWEQDNLGQKWEDDL